MNRIRATGFVDAPVLRNLHAVAMLMAAGVLLLPLPIPLSNTVPAWVILLIAAGLLERDGMFVAGGYAVAGAGMVAVALLGGAAHQLLEVLKRWMAG